MKQDESMKTCIRRLHISHNAPYLAPKILHKAACKQTQHCWPTTPNIVACYMLHLFAHPVACCWMLLRVVAESLKPVKLLAPCKRTQHCWLI